MKTKTQRSKIYGMKAVLGGVYSNASLPQEIFKKSQINILTKLPKELEKEKTKPKASRRRQIIKIRAEINEIETKNNRKDQ